MSRADRPARPSPPATASHGGALPLSRLLSGCAEAVAAVRQGHSLTDALARRPAADRPGVQALSFSVMRHLGTAVALRQALVPKAPAPWVDALLLSALALIDTPAYDPHTLVDQAVEAVKRRQRGAAGMVNAVLRRYLRERDALLAATQQDPVAVHNHPVWWIQRLRQDWPDHWQALLAANQSPPPMTLRVNRRHGDAARYRARLIEAGLVPELAPEASDALGLSAPDAITLQQGVPVQRLPGFDQGDVSVQDRAAQLAAPLLVLADGQPLPAGARVLDACAAPGGKTTHLLELAELDVLALDADATRLIRVTESLQRLGVHATTLAADARHPETWWDGRPFDAILLDAPCSASGIVRRHPDVRWLRRDSDIAALAQTQDALLDALWPLLRAGGHLLYCTCSVFKAEGQDRVDAFLQRAPDARLRPSPGHLLPVVEYPDPVGPSGQDGFFYALLQKSRQGA